jgi:cellulose biosynthesis protein BcsQ
LPFFPENCRNESEVESKLIVQYLLPALGYSPDTWYQEVAFGSIRLDFLAFARGLYDSLSSVIIEAKHPNQNLNNHVYRLSQYLTSLNIQYGLLTNGREIRIYQKDQNQIKLLFKCLGKDVENNLSAIKSIIGKEVLTKDGSNTSLPEIANKNTAKLLYQIEQELIRLEQLYNAGFTPEGQHTMKTIAVYHNKGGVGKTTTVVNLAAALSKRGKRVLVIDLDSQANTTFATGLIKFDDEELDNLKDSNIRHVLQSEEAYPIRQVARPSQFNQPEIDVIPSHISLMRYEQELSQLADIKIMLDEKLQAVNTDYDIVIFDTPPALNLFSEIALTTADYLLIPSDLKPFANQGLLNIKEFFKRIDKFRKIIGKPPINILGVLPCKISTNSKFVQSTLPKRIAAIPKRYGFEVMDSVIYEREDLAKSMERTTKVDDIERSDPRSVFDYKPDSISAQEFEVLATEVLRKIGVAE